MGSRGDHIEGPFRPVPLERLHNLEQPPASQGSRGFGDRVEQALEEIDRQLVEEEATVVDQPSSTE